MKNTFILLFALIALQSTAQTTVTERDSSYVELIGGVYYQVRDVVYPSGDQLTTKTQIGTATDALELSVAKYTRQSAQMAEVARTASFYKARITEIIREGNAAKGPLKGASPLDTLQARTIAPFLVPGWTIKNGGVTQIVFSVNAGGLFRYKLGTDPIKNAVLLGSIIRLRNYGQPGEDVDLYVGDNGNYADILRRYILRKP